MTRAIPRSLFVALLAGAASCAPAHGDALPPEEAGPSPTLRIDGERVVRGVTVGPIESALHPDVGYGSAAYQRQLDACARMGATWISLTPFGRVADLSGMGVDPTFETPFDLNFPRVLTAIRMAHARGLKVMLVPHLWVESGDWRALIDPGTDAGWEAWAASYERFILAWAEVAEAGKAELLSAGAELRSWVTSARAPSFSRVVGAIRGVYGGMVTYSANWDDVADTVVLGDLDVIGINAFYPLADRAGAGEDELRRGGERVRQRVHALAEAWHKPVIFTEFGYTTRKDPAVKPWEWPDGMKGVEVDERAQATAYRALLGALIDEPDFAGFFVWRVYSDPDDVSQEAEWGFSPEGKQAELVLRDAFAARWAGEEGGFGEAAKVPGVWP